MILFKDIVFFFQKSLSGYNLITSPAPGLSSSFFFYTTFPGLSLLLTSRRNGSIALDRPSLCRDNPSSERFQPSLFSFSLTPLLCFKHGSVGESLFLLPLGEEITSPPRTPFQMLGIVLATLSPPFPFLPGTLPASLSFASRSRPSKGRHLFETDDVGPRLSFWFSASLFPFLRRVSLRTSPCPLCTFPLLSPETQLFFLWERRPVLVDAFAFFTQTILLALVGCLHKIEPPPPLLAFEHLQR